MPETTIKPRPAAELPWVLEALLFASGDPQPLGALARAAGVGEGPARRALAQLAEDLSARGLRLLNDGQGHYQLGHAPEYAAYVEQLIGAGVTQRLSRAALETLAIIAYRQPCTRAEVEAIRGVNSDRLMGTLEARSLIDVVGQSEGPGRPKLYRTTIKFFEHFGLSSPSELPPLPDTETGAEVNL
jgi:segregation and condensation protein B